MDSFYNVEELKALGLKSFGDNVKVSRKASIYGADKVSLGNNVRIDDFCCLVGGEGGIEIGSYIHIAFFCIILGNGGVQIKDFAGLSSRTAIYSATDDYSGQYLSNPTVPSEYLGITKGMVVLNKHVLVGTNSTILPSVKIGEGCSIGAHSLVNKDLESWGVYLGVPVKRIRDRKTELLQLEKELIKKYGI